METNGNHVQASTTARVTSQSCAEAVTCGRPTNGELLSRESLMSESDKRHVSSNYGKVDILDDVEFKKDRGARMISSLVNKCKPERNRMDDQLKWPRTEAGEWESFAKAFYVGSFLVKGKEGRSQIEHVRRYLVSMRNAKAITRPVLLKVSLAGIKICDLTGQHVYMAHVLRRISYAACDSEYCQFSLVSHEMRERRGRERDGEKERVENSLFCHVFVTNTSDETEKLNSIVNAAFQMAFAHQRQQQTQIRHEQPKQKQQQQGLGQPLQQQMQDHASLPVRQEMLQEQEDNKLKQLLTKVPLDATNYQLHQPYQIARPYYSENARPLDSKIVEKDKTIDRKADKERSGRNNCKKGSREDSMTWSKPESIFGSIRKRLHTLNARNHVSKTHDRKSRDSTICDDLAKCAVTSSTLVRPPEARASVMDKCSRLSAQHETIERNLGAKTASTGGVRSNNGDVTPTNLHRSGVPCQNNEGTFRLSPQYKRINESKSSQLSDNTSRLNGQEEEIYNTGTLRSRSTSRPRNLDSTTMDTTHEDLSEATWFKCGLSREDALDILSQSVIGSFIVRASATQCGCYALSVKVPKFDNPAGISHYLIFRTDRGRYKMKGLEKEWSTLTALITHHSVMPELLPCTLRLDGREKMRRTSDYQVYAYYYNDQRCC